MVGAIQRSSWDVFRSSLRGYILENPQLAARLHVPLEALLDDTTGWLTDALIAVVGHQHRRRIRIISPDAHLCRNFDELAGPDDPICYLFFHTDGSLGRESEPNHFSPLFIANCLPSSSLMQVDSDWDAELYLVRPPDLNLRPTRKLIKNSSRNPLSGPKAPHPLTSAALASRKRKRYPAFSDNDASPRSSEEDDESMSDSPPSPEGPIAKTIPTHAPEPD